VADYFEAAVKAGGAAIPPQTVANWVLGELFRLLRDRAVTIEQARVAPEALAELLALVGRGQINQTVAKEVLEEMFTGGQRAEAIIARRGLTQISDETRLLAIVQEVLAANPKPVQQFLEGKEQVLGFLVGQAMKATRGQANVQLVTRLLRQELGK